MNSYPIFIMMMGLSGSGKSTLASNLYIDENGNIDIREEPNATGDPVIHSSDNLRAELFGDVNNQKKNDELFIELHRRIKRDLAAGHNVIYDATNLNKKRRIAFLEELRRIHCVKYCLAVMTTFEDCKKNNAKRERHVPEDVIKRQFMNWQPPHYHEGFDNIWLVFPCSDGFNPDYYVHDANYDNMKKFNQDNSHHALSLGDHCFETFKSCRKWDEENSVLQTAAYLHDVGKLYTKTYVNAKGEKDGQAHYYQHECVGAYVAAFILNSTGYPVNETLDAINMIFYHMRPYLAWKDSEKSMERDKKLIGEKMFNDVMLLHKADVAAH